MANIGFDLDETLGEFFMAHYTTLFLQPHIVVYEGTWSGIYAGIKRNPPIPLTDSLKSALDSAFDLFIDCVAEKEKRGLGLLRPGIVDMAKRLYALQQMGKVKSVIIYSNNGNLALLHMAGKLIERLANAPGLFCNYIHWFHPLRESEVVKGRPGIADKTFQVLLQAFQTGSCKPGEISRENVFFFDDALHFDIYSYIPNQYFHISPYKYDVDPEELIDCFKTAFVNAGLDKNREYFTFISEIIGLNPSQDSLEKMNASIFQRLESDKKIVRRKIIPNNTNFHKRFYNSFPLSKKDFLKSLQTVRRFENRLNKGETLKNEESKKLSNAKALLNSFELQTPNLSGGKRTRKTRRQKPKHAKN